MDALVTASFLLVGWNTYSAIIVAKDTYTGKMPGPKSIGYSIAGLAGLTAFMLYTYGIAAEKHPELLEAESFAAEEMCLACNSVNQDPETHAYCETCRVKCVVCGELLDEDTDGENYENKICGTVSCYEEAGIIPEWMGNSYYANDYLQGFPAEVLEKYGYGAESFSAEDREDTERMTRPEAEALADKVEKLVAPYTDRVEVCGSYRRGSSRPGDLDVIIIPKKGVTLPDMVKAINPSAVNWIGEKKTQVIIDGRKVDFRVSSPKGWGAAQLYFTGPAGYNIGMRMRAKKMGMKLNEYGIFDRATDKYLGGATEDEIYQVLGKTPKTPSERSKRAEQTFGRLKPDPNKCAQCGTIGETFAVHTLRGPEKYFCGPICHYKYEGLAAETQTFEAPRATYTDPAQQSFEKSYNIRAKKPLNKIVKESSGGKLPSDDSRQYYGYGRSHKLTDLSVADHKLIQSYLTIQNMAYSRFETTNSGWAEDASKYQTLNATNVIAESIKKTPYLAKAVKHYHGLFGCKTDQEKIDYMNNANMTSTDFEEMLDFIRYYDITETGPYKGIRMVATDRAPYETGGGYGNVYYNSRNPYGHITHATKFGEYDKTNKEFSLSSKSVGATFTRLTKLRPYTTFPNISIDPDTFIEYTTDGGYQSYKGSGRQSFRLTPFVCPESTRSDQRNPDPGYSSRQMKDGWRYDIKGWEAVKSAPYRYATLVYLPTEMELQLIHGNKKTGTQLGRKTIVSLYNEAKKLYTEAQSQAKAKREEEEAKEEAASNLSRKNQALTELENATKAMQDVIKSLVNQARNRGVPEDEIYDALENTLYDIEEMIEDWEPSDYWDAESSSEWSCSCEEGEDCEDTCSVCLQCGTRTITAGTPFADEYYWPNREKRVKSAKGKYNWYARKGCDYCGEWLPEEAGYTETKGVFIPRIEMKPFVRDAESEDENIVCASHLDGWRYCDEDMDGRAYPEPCVVCDKKYCKNCWKRGVRKDNICERCYTASGARDIDREERWQRYLKLQEEKRKSMGWLKRKWHGLAEDAKKAYGCKVCGNGPLPATVLDDKVFVLCPTCGLGEGSEDATGWNVTWTEDTPKVMHNRPFADVEWDTPPEE